MTKIVQLSAPHERIVREVLTQWLPAGIEARAFGSRVWGQPRPYSDLDLALKGSAPIERSVVGDLADAFCESDLPFKVDISDWSGLSPALREAVDRNGVDLTQAS